MNEATFSFCNENNIIKISGIDYDKKTLQNFLNFLTQISEEKKNTNIKIIGDFDSKLLFQNLITDKHSQDLDEILIMFQLICKTMQNSESTFSAEINGIVQGPAMEIALCCNFIKADNNTVLKLNEVNQGIIPILGTVQRLTKLIGYKNSLKAFLIDKQISYEQGLKLLLFNNKTDNLTKIEHESFFWDQVFTNTFIFYNSKIHSIYKNKNPACNAILSIIFETSVCNNAAGLSIEKRWLKWLINHKHFANSIEL